VSIDERLRAIIRCPACLGMLDGPVAAANDEQELVCTQCGLRYPVRDDIPVLLADEARGPDDPR
jgi:uncharacterized protein